MSLIELSTMTLDGTITNVRFNKEHTINLLTLSRNIVEIGCNYGYMVSEEYKSSKLYKDRLKKKKNKGQDTRKKQGLGTHFNSQITFTILCDADPNNTYQVKLFTNGRVQIPGIGNFDKDNDSLLNNMIDILCSYIKQHGNALMFREHMPINVINISPILQNYKSITLGAEDCNQGEVKYWVNKKKEIKVAAPNLDLSELKRIFLEYHENQVRLPILLHSVVCHSERYPGFLIKFSTPKIITDNYKLDKFIEMARLYYKKKVKKPKLKPINILESDSKIEKICKMIKNAWAENNKCVKKVKPKQTTVKLFKTGKINIDHANNEEQTIMIRKIVVDTINSNWDNVIYYPDNYLEPEELEIIRNEKRLQEIKLMEQEEKKDISSEKLTFDKLSEMIFSSI